MQRCGRYAIQATDEFDVLLYVTHCPGTPLFVVPEVYPKIHEISPGIHDLSTGVYELYPLDCWNMPPQDQASESLSNDSVLSIHFQFVHDVPTTTLLYRLWRIKFR